MRYSVCTAANKAMLQQVVFFNVTKKNGAYTMRKNTKAAKAANVVQVTTTNNTTVKHAKFITLQQVAKQNAANAHLYTAAQHAVAANVIRAAQAYYFTKQVYTNIRKKFIAVKIANNTSCCYALAQIAKQNNAQVVITKNATILRLFA